MNKMATEICSNEVESGVELCSKQQYRDEHRLETAVLHIILSLVYITLHGDLT